MADVPTFDAPPWRLSGTVVAALLNHRPLWAEMGSAAHQPPYKSPAQAPVLAVMPRHTQVFSGRPIAVPQGCGRSADAAGAGLESDTQGGVEVGVALGIVIGRVASSVPVEMAMSFVAGYLVVGELTLPVPSGASAHYRPGARLRARDGFCPLGDRVVPAAAISTPDALSARVEIDGRVVQVTDTGDRLRGVARLVADVSAFMTLRPGDVLTLGRSHPPPRARAGQRIRLSIDGVGAIENALVPEVAGSTGVGGALNAGPAR